MKGLIYIACAFLIGSVFMTVKAQTVEVKYKKQIVPNADNLSRWVRSAAEKRSHMQRLEEKAQNERSYYDLVTDGTYATFRYDTTIVMNKKADEDRGRWWWGGSSEGLVNWEQDLRSGDVTIRAKLLPDSICRSINYRQKYNWEMEKGTKVFCKMMCNKAIHISEEGDTTIAWFTRSIPISSGPEEYGGLPGMIMAIETPSINYIAEEIKKVDTVVDYRSVNPSACLDKEKFEEKARKAFMEKRLQNEN